jgi:hypothetical protein
LERIEDRPWLEKRSDPALESHILKRVVWQRWKLIKLISSIGVDLLFMPGRSIITDFCPVVTMEPQYVTVRMAGTEAIWLLGYGTQANDLALGSECFSEASGWHDFSHSICLQCGH